MSVIDPWRAKVEIVEQAYKLPNYKISYTGNKTGYCYIYCSSNDIWYPNESERFVESIINKDYYEWTRLRSHNAEKEIFLRDIYKSWYVTGINNSICNISALIEFLRQETANYNVVTVGSSAGGYLAALIGSELNAEYVIAFSAQFDLENKWAMEVNPFLQKHKKDAGQYYDLSPRLATNITKIFYICPIRCESDKHQYDHISKCNSVRTIKFHSKRHGVVLLRSSIQHLLDVDGTELQKLFDQFKDVEVDPTMFSVYLVGWRTTLKDVKYKTAQILIRCLTGKLRQRGK